MSHLTFFMAVTLFLVVGTIVSINGIGLNLSGTAFGQPQPQANFTSIEQELLTEGRSFNAFLIFDSDLVSFFEVGIKAIGTNYDNVDLFPV